MWVHRLFRIKSIGAVLAEPEENPHALKRVLGPVHLTMLGVGAIVGAGIFALVGTAAAGDGARPGAGPGIMVSFLVTGVACTFTALCYAEFASLAPISGSAYTYAYTSLGEIVAWIIGWDLILEYAVGNIAVAVSWSGYFCELVRGFGWEFPRWLATDLRTALNTPEILASVPRVLGVPMVFNLPAVFIVTAISVVLVAGIKESAWFNAMMVGIKLIVLAFFVAVGLWYVEPDNWRPFAPNGWRGIQAGAAVVFFAFIGFDAVSTCCRGMPQPAARPAHRHPRFPGDLYGDLCRGGGRAHRHDPLGPTQYGRAALGGHAGGQPAWGRGNRGLRFDRGAYGRTLGLPIGPAEDPVLDGS